MASVVKDYLTTAVIMLLRFASIKDRAAGPIGIIHQAEGLAALNDGRMVIDCACLWEKSSRCDSLQNELIYRSLQKEG